MRNPLDINDLAAKICTGERAALSRGITLVESTLPQHLLQAQALLEAIEQRKTNASNAQRIGITGSPGAGKSTFIEALGQQLIEQGHKIAVLAIDPSSTKTRGSILGDKTRMPDLTRNGNAFIRPSPAGTTLGGVANATRQSILLCEAAGYSSIIIETVGVGQSEHAVRDLCDCMALLVLPGSGDSLQGIKRGIVELADIVVVNKNDGDRKPLAAQTRRDYAQALHLQVARIDGWSPTAVTVSSIAKGGLDRFSESLEKYFTCLEGQKQASLRNSQAVRWFDRSWSDQLIYALRIRPDINQALEQVKSRISAGEISDIKGTRLIAELLLKRLDK